MNDMKLRSIDKDITNDVVMITLGPEGYTTDDGIRMIVNAIHSGEASDLFLIDREITGDESDDMLLKTDGSKFTTGELKKLLTKKFEIDESTACELLESAGYRLPRSCEG